MDADNGKNIAPELSIILISYNTSRITQETIESIYRSLAGRNSHSYELIVLDNGSEDDSVLVLKHLQSKYTNLELIESEENLGFSKGNNKAMEKARGTYIFFLNSDIIVLRDAIEKMLTFYKENESSVHFLGGKLLNRDGTNQPSCGPFYTPFVVFGALFLKGDYWGLTRQSPNVTTRTDWVSGACILTKKSYFDALGGFDRDIFMYMEEIDLLYRASQKGFHTYCYPKAQFIHLGSASSGGKTFPIIQVYRGFLYFYKKHYGSGSLFFLRCMLQLKAVLALIIGKLSRNRYLIETYEHAYKIASMD